jgi:hypothetical protein
VSRVINPDSAGKQRTQMAKAVALALRQLALQTAMADEARDLAAFISLGLEVISQGIDASVAAWEKRGYWVKADKFRLEWDWAAKVSSRMGAAVKVDDWSEIAALAIQAAGKLRKVQISERHKLGKPWLGAYTQLRQD